MPRCLIKRRAWRQYARAASGGTRRQRRLRAYWQRYGYIINGAANIWLIRHIRLRHDTAGYAATLLAAGRVDAAATYTTIDVGCCHIASALMAIADGLPLLPMMMAHTGRRPLLRRVEAD